MTGDLEQSEVYLFLNLRTPVCPLGRRQLHTLYRTAWSVAIVFSFRFRINGSTTVSFSDTSLTGAKSVVGGVYRQCI